MTINNFLVAIAGKLKDLWPDRNVYVNQIPQHADGNFFVGVSDIEQDRHLDRRRKRHLQFEILYFLKSHDNTEFHEWLETMLDNFEKLTVKESDTGVRGVHLTNLEARQNDDMHAYQFVFDADFYFLLAPEDGESMQDLALKEGIG